jgi:DNA-binding transcriptional LysR family regulator
MSMNINILRQYIALAGVLNFSKAAKGLHVAQPTLSRNIALLEKDMGARLLNRNREISLTAAGKYVLEQASGIVETYDRMLADAHKLRTEYAQKLRVEDLSTLPLLTRRLRGAILRVHEEMPDCDIRFQSISGMTSTQALLEDVIDIGFYWLFYSDSVSLEGEFGDSIAFRELKSYKNELMLAMQKGHPFSSRPKLRLADLEHLKLLRPADVAINYPMSSMERICERAGVKLSYRLLAVGSVTDILTERLEDDDVMCISASMIKAGTVPDVMLEKLVFMDFEDVDLRLRTFVLWRKDRENPVTDCLLNAITGAVDM